VSDDEITFQAIVARVQTMADNGLRVTLDLPEQAVLEAAQLMELKRLGVVLDVTVRAES
jgi:positive regulator of sigma E activity